jgi:NAD(P)-dependent dehydrogenase (short-subunit alcohol dehydrogenase family)
LTRLLSTEIALKGFSVRVNAIAPGVYASEMTTNELRPEDTDKVGKGIQPVPAKRPGRYVFFPAGTVTAMFTGVYSIEEMAGTAVYLSSRAGGYLNGQEIIIDGGYVAVNPSV